MVAASRQATPMRAVTRRFGVVPPTVPLLVARAGSRRHGRVHWVDRPDAPRRPANRRPPEPKDRVPTPRREPKEAGNLGEFGARAIRDARTARGGPLPSLRAIHG